MSNNRLTTWDKNLRQQMCSRRCSAEMGGGTQAMPWKQLLTDVLRIPLYATTVAAASARGAALLAGIGIGVYADTNDTLKLAATPTLAATPQSVDSALEEAWMRYQSLYPRLQKSDKNYDSRR